MWAKNIHNSGVKGKKRESQCRDFMVMCLSLKCLKDIFVVRILKEVWILPVDGMAHTRDESRQEHEGFPVWRFFTCDPAHITVGPTISLEQKNSYLNSTLKRGKKLELIS